MDKKIKLSLVDLEVRSFIALPMGELKKVAGAATQYSSINTKFTNISACCCGYTQETT